MPKFGSGKVGTKDVAVFFRQFSVMIDAGLPLVQCLEILAANQENQTFQKTLTGVRTTVEGGATLANAMRQYPAVFDDLRRALGLLVVALHDVHAADQHFADFAGLQLVAVVVDDFDLAAPNRLAAGAIAAKTSSATLAASRGCAHFGSSP